MATPYLGRGTTVGAGVESTWGTAVARTNWLRLLSGSLTRTVDQPFLPHLGTLGATSANRRKTFVASDRAAGDLEFVMAYDDSTVLMMQHLFGAVATAGAAPYTHTMTLAEALPTGLTLEQINGTGSGEVFEGCKLNTGVISVTAGEPMKCRLGVLAETSGGLTAAGSPTYSSNGLPILHHQVGQFAFNAVNYDLIDLEISIDNKLGGDRHLLGSKFTAEQQRSDFTEVVIRVTLEYSEDTLYAALLAQTQSDATVTFSGTGNNVLAITGQNCLLRDVGQPVSGPGIIRQTAEFVCLSDGTDEGLKFIFTNDNTAASDN